jgi:hypothetical protein
VRASAQPRHAEASALQAVIREHLDGFLRAATDRHDEAGLPEFIMREFREFLTGGVLAHGCARVRYERCAFEHLLPFSYQGPGFCPSHGGRRISERAAHLVDEVIPFVPVRQRVLTLPYRLRYLVARNHGLSRAMLVVHAWALRDSYRQQAQRQGIPAGRTGTVTAGQRFGGGPNLRVHVHTLALVFTLFFNGTRSDGMGARDDESPGDLGDGALMLIERETRRRGYHGPGEGTIVDPEAKAQRVIDASGDGEAGKMALERLGRCAPWRAMEKRS